VFDAGMPYPATLRLRLGQMLGLRTYSLECSTYVTHGHNEVLGTFVHARTCAIHCAIHAHLASTLRGLHVTASVRRRQR
jgi:hypothetical protein